MLYNLSDDTVLARNSTGTAAYNNCKYMRYTATAESGCIMKTNYIMNICKITLDYPQNRVKLPLVVLHLSIVGDCLAGWLAGGRCETLKWPRFHAVVGGASLYHCIEQGVGMAHERVYGLVRLRREERLGRQQSMWCSTA